MTSSRHAAVWPLRMLLRVGSVRRRLAFAIAHDYSADLHLSLPLDDALTVPLDDRDAFAACAETFVEAEYAGLLAHAPIPARWLDVGAHRGYFSLWLAWQRRRAGLPGTGTALLVDADPRAARWFETLLAVNPSLRAFVFCPGAITATDRTDPVAFVQRGGMGSSLASETAFGPGAPTITVPPLSADAVHAAMPPPYDLIKVDVEGAEFAFLQGFGALIRQARHLVVEWHDYGHGRSAAARLDRAAADLGFGEPIALRPERTIAVNGQTITSGLHLYRRERS